MFRVCTVSRGPECTGIVTNVRARNFFIFVRGVVHSYVDHCLSNRVIFSNLHGLAGQVSRLVHTVFFRLTELNVAPTTSRTVRATHFNSIDVNPAIASRRHLVTDNFIGPGIIRHPLGGLVFIRAQVVFTNAMGTISRNIRVRVLTGQGTLVLQLTTYSHRMMSIDARFNRLF